LGKTQAGNRKIECSGCGRKFHEFYDVSERAVRDLPWSSFQTTVHIEIYRVIQHSFPQPRWPKLES